MPSDRLLLAGLLFGLCFVVLLVVIALVWMRRRRRRRRFGMHNYFRD